MGEYDGSGWSETMHRLQGHIGAWLQCENVVNTSESTVTFCRSFFLFFRMDNFVFYLFVPFIFRTCFVKYFLMKRRGFSWPPGIFLKKKKKYSKGITVNEVNYYILVQLKRKISKSMKSEAYFGNSGRLDFCKLVLWDQTT